MYSKLGKICNQKRKKMYKLIWSNTVESCMSDALYKQMTTVISAHDNKNFRYSSEKNIFPGWKIVKGANDTTEYYDYLLNLDKTRAFDYSKIACNFSIKDLEDAYYTEAKLVELLESGGELVDHLHLVVLLIRFRIAVM